MRAVNLLPADLRPRRGSGKPGSAYVVVGVLGAVVLAGLVYVLTLNGINSNKEKIAQVEAEKAQAEQRAAASASFTSFAQVKATRVQSVTDLAKARLDWERLMRELSLVLPETAYVTSLEATSNGGGAAGGSATAGPTMTLIGCARSHSDVATVLVRLKKLYRASDVKLKDSTRGGVTGGACGTGSQFTAVVEFVPVAPASEAPRGQEQVPASLGGGS